MAGPCRLALVLALDVSGSVDANEDRLQREGLASALLSSEVVQAFLQGDPVALFVFEWASTTYQADVTPDWQMVRSEEDLARIADVILKTRERESDLRPGAGATAIGAALFHAEEVLDRSPDCRAHTVDVAGDGESNQGPSLGVIYADPLDPFYDGVTVNALVIRGALNDRGDPTNDGDLVAYFEADVLHGPGAFCLLADGYEDYQRAMQAKLRREVMAPMVSGAVSGPRAG